MATKKIEIELPNWLDGAPAEGWRTYSAGLEESGYVAGADVIRSLIKALEREEKRRFIQPEELRDGQVVRVIEEWDGSRVSGPQRDGKRTRITEGVVCGAHMENGTTPFVGGYRVQVVSSQTNVTIELLEDAPEPEPLPIYVTNPWSVEYQRLRELGVDARDILYPHSHARLEGRRADDIIVSLGATGYPTWPGMLEVLEGIAAKSKNGTPIRVVQDIVAEAKAKVAA